MNAGRDPFVHYVLEAGLARDPGRPCVHAVYAGTDRAYGDHDRDLTVFRSAGPDTLRDVRWDGDPSGAEPGTWHFRQLCPFGSWTRPRHSGPSQAVRTSPSWDELMMPGVGGSYQDAGSLAGVEAHLTTIGQRIGSGTRDGEPGIIAQLARMEALQQATSRQVEEIHRMLGLERDEDDAAVSGGMTAEQRRILYSLIGPSGAGESELIVTRPEDPDAQREQYSYLMSALDRAAAGEVIRLVNQHGHGLVLLVPEEQQGIAQAVIIPAEDWHEPDTCCCKNCPWRGNHGER